MFGSQEMVKGLGIGTGLAMLRYTSMPGSFLILALLSGFALILTLRKLSDHRETQVVSLNQIFAVKRNMKVLAYARALFYASRDVWLVAALPIYLSQSGATNIELGMLMSASYIVYGASQPIGILIIKQVWRFRTKTVKKPWRFRNSLIWLTLLAALIPAAAAWQSDNIDRFAFLILLAGVANGILVTSHNHLHLKFAKKNRSSLDISYYKTIANLGKILAMAGSGILYDRWSMEGCLYAASGILCLSAILTLRLRKPEDPSKRFLKQDANKNSPRPQVL
jgi:predicted MFS family arabinose efflux permease